MHWISRSQTASRLRTDAARQGAAGQFWREKGSVAMAGKAKRLDGTSAVPEAAKPIYDVIVGLTDRFCQAHLTHEYQMLCRTLTATLARKRPTPLTRGKPEVWACGIVRTIGWVNFLDDSSQKPHLKLTSIDKAFGVGESTGQGKSVLIRKMLTI